ncbi:HNH endonuclease family protein [Streptomyces sp. NPDC002458]|uniref:HNH endonuclease family protein n=1 Tax=Streptomyces sp. NPDC002458 TaxID=3364644 RepID=UPI0036A55A99
MANMVNLDALIKREDFELVGEVEDSPTGIQSIRATDLALDGLVYHTLRKPDFQRETANWTPDKVAALVRSFLEGDLIPAIILWRSGLSGKVFVIDGAHRLSALAAWVQDDYGDRHVSQRFFESNIPDEQRKAAESTRQLIQESTGSFVELSHVLRSDDAASNEKMRLARNLSIVTLPIQWVPGTAEKAESSFYRINQQGTSIDDTELEMIKARKKPNAVAARAFIRAGTGHKYWSSFDASVQADIESIANEVNDLIFKPHLSSNIRSADLPAGGGGYTTDSMRMVFEFVNFANGVQSGDRRGKGKAARGEGQEAETVHGIAEDSDGSETIKYMRTVKRSAERIAGNSSGSLGLHPVVYFYSFTGKFQPAAFLAAVAFVQELYEKRKLSQFTQNRYAFEEFLVKHKYFLNQIVRRRGGWHRSVTPIYRMYATLLSGCVENASHDEIIQQLQHPKVANLPVRVAEPGDYEHGRDFSGRIKNAVYLNTLLRDSTRCAICRARLSPRFSSVDHDTRKEDGGMGKPENGQLAHPYCNSGYKEQQHASN